MLRMTVAQPCYFAGETPDREIADFLYAQMHSMESGSLLLLPEYANAGGLSDPAKELAALPRAAEMKHAAAKIAREKQAYISLNVLEEREGKLRNSTYLFAGSGEVAFIYDKVHLPPAEVKLGIRPGDGACICDLDGIRFAFMTCYDVYFNEQIEHIAAARPDVILVPGYQRGERVDIIRAQAKLAAFRCNAYLVRASYSMQSDERGGCSMIVAPDGRIIQDMGQSVGVLSHTADVKEKYMRPAGFGGAPVRNDDFIAAGLRPDVFAK